VGGGPLINVICTFVCSTLLSIMVFAVYCHFFWPPHGRSVFVSVLHLPYNHRMQLNENSLHALFICGSHSKWWRLKCLLCPYFLNISRQIVAMSGQKRVALATPIPLHLVDGAINWDLCCICQNPGGNLRCPAKNPNLSMRNVGYNTFSANVESLKGTNHVFPSGRKPENFDEGSGVRETLTKHEAKFHSKCHLNYTTRFTQEPAQPTSTNTSIICKITMNFFNSE